jgi:hypothetical protein
MWPSNGGFLHSTTRFLVIANSKQPGEQPHAEADLFYSSSMTSRYLFCGKDQNSRIRM